MKNNIYIIVAVVMIVLLLFFSKWSFDRNRIENLASSGQGTEILPQSNDSINGGMSAMPDLLDNEDIIRVPIESSQQANVVEDWMPRIGLERLILTDSSGTHVMASFTRNRTDAEFALFPYFKFHDYYILGDHVYYIFSENGYVYLGSSIRKPNGSFVRNGEEKLLSSGLIRLNIVWKEFIPATDDGNLQMKLGNTVYYKIYELNQSGEFELKEEKLNPEYNYEAASKITRLTRNNLPGE